jgi:hypothetical protein
MGTRFENITLKDMDKFLVEQGFRRMELEGINEVVYGIRVDRNKTPLTLRINTACNPEDFGGQSRKIGKDAIRVQLFMRYNGKVVPVGKSQKCLRVKSWRKNLLKAINAATNDIHWKTCPACGHPMVIRQSHNGNPFWACVTYFETKCTGRISNASKESMD